MISSVNELSSIVCEFSLPCAVVSIQVSMLLPNSVGIAVDKSLVLSTFENILYFQNDHYKHRSSCSECLSA
ncbi:unnamed protein product [Macrosiphum euphorbiae]|uniref:Uncharacterized protein n=1 Tax=Macrosiphum euphorbiae TaxID=13131 RepID=A0AAV0VKH0_9HEMI|nr:unnamed protein product [Macrosiphum euphorbiae]